MMKKRLAVIFLILAAALPGFARDIVSDTLWISFRQGQAQLDPEYSGNAKALDRLRKRVQDSKEGLSKRILGMHVSSAASPDGNSKENQMLSDLRAQNVVDYMRENLSLREIPITKESRGVDWDGLVEVLRRSDMPDRAKVIDIVKNVPLWIKRDGVVVDGRKKRLMDMNGGRTWDYMRDHIFNQPQFIAVSIACEYIDYGYSAPQQPLTQQPAPSSRLFNETGQEVSKPKIDVPDAPAPKAVQPAEPQAPLKRRTSTTKNRKPQNNNPATIFNTKDMDRYHKVIAESGVTTDDAVVAAEVAKILEKVPEYSNKEVYKYLLSSIDLTTLSTEDSQSSVTAFTQRVNDFDNEYPQYRNVAAICVYSNFADVVSTTLEVTGVDVAVVAGGFPSSQTFTAVKVADVALAVAGGANEVDIVMNLGYYLDENYEDLCDEIIEIKHTAKDARLKVILETGALKTAENIRNASILAMYSEADFIKTSTGKIYPGASLEAAWVMCQCIKEYYEKTGRMVGFKAAGGIRTAEDAVKYYAIVKEVLGDAWLTQDYFRIGASSLANALLSASEGADIKFF